MTLKEFCELVLSDLELPENKDLKSSILVFNGAYHEFVCTHTNKDEIRRLDAIIDKYDDGFLSGGATDVMFLDVKKMLNPE